MGDLGPKAQLVPLLPSEKGHTLTISTLLEATGKERCHRNHQVPTALTRCQGRAMTWAEAWD